MSVTFYTAATIAHEAAETFYVPCLFEEEGCKYSAADGLTFEQAIMFVAVACPVHGETQAFPESEATAPTPVKVDLSNGRAARLFGYLGIDDGFNGGQMDAEEFRARAFDMIRSLGPEDDAGAPDISYWDGGAVMTECGQWAGYWTQRAYDLVDVADAAEEQDGLVMWS